ncbi:MAG: tRNA lysidine(34) synthetase TilS [Candidatus Dormibacteraeota bacterium]|nr:tRNA lysidine(34) synthetase TilS [Candidatus Dormibacteraeota bacterium]
MLPTESSQPLLLGLRRSDLIRPGDRVLVAVSGGPDSTALLMAAREQGHDVVAAHYDHALQAGSGAAALHVRQLCAGLGVELVTERRSAKVPRGSLQAAARTLRYDFLERARAETAADVVGLAHTADDRVEGVVLHLMRGCGLAGLRGMPARRGRFVRPLLSVWRHEVLDFLRARDVIALEDPANANTAYARVRVRREILPELERGRPGITRRFNAAAVRAAALQESVAAEASGMLGAGGLNRSILVEAPEPLAAELMRLLYARAGGAQPALSRAHVKLMLGLAQPGRGGRGLDLPGGLRLRIVGETMEIVVSEIAQTRQDGPASRLEIVACPGCDEQHVAHLSVGLDLRLGFRTPGLTMRPVGGRGTRKLQDIFVDARVPREERDRWPLVFSGERLAWVPGVAVDANLSSLRGVVGQHVSIVPWPIARSSKNAVLESPDSPSGEPT